MKTALLSLSVLLCWPLWGQSSQEYNARFERYWAQGDTVSIRKLLAAWEATLPEDPEMMVAQVNYLTATAMTEGVIMSDTVGPEGGLKISDSLGNVVGYMVPQVLLDTARFQRGLGYLERGITLHPNRLDMRFGLIYMLGKTHFFTAQNEQIQALLVHHFGHSPEWLWSQGKAIEQSDEDLLRSVQDYFIMISQGSRNNLEEASVLARRMIEYWPEAPEGYSNLGACYLSQDEYKEAIKWFKKALKQNPEDGIVLSNLAYTYEDLGKLRKARKYYEQLLESEDENLVTYAQEQLSRLNEGN